MSAVIVEQSTPVETNHQDPRELPEPSTMLSGGRNVSAQMHYLDEARSDNSAWKTPKKGVLQKSPGSKVWDIQSVTVTDVTPNIGAFTLDREGFQYVHLNSQEKDFVDDERIKAVYYPEIENLLREVTGASRVIIFNHLVRGPNKKGGETPTALPAFHVHGDQSPEGATQVLRDTVGGEADVLLKKRWQIVNVWKPIKTIHKDPFAVTAAESVSNSDLVYAYATLPSGNKGSGWSSKYNQDHRWYYKYRQTPEDVLVFKNHDSATDGRATRVLHSSFVDEEEKDASDRESLECRCLCLYDH